MIFEKRNPLDFFSYEPTFGDAAAVKLYASLKYDGMLLIARCEKEGTVIFPQKSNPKAVTATIENNEVKIENVGGSGSNVIASKLKIEAVKLLVSVMKPKQWLQIELTPFRTIGDTVEEARITGINPPMRIHDTATDRTRTSQLPAAIASAAAAAPGPPPKRPRVAAEAPWLNETIAYDRTMKSPGGAPAPVATAKAVVSVEDVVEMAAKAGIYFEQSPDPDLYDVRVKNSSRPISFHGPDDDPQKAPHIIVSGESKRLPTGSTIYFDDEELKITDKTARIMATIRPWRFIPYKWSKFKEKPPTIKINRYDQSIQILGRSECQDDRVSEKQLSIHIDIESGNVMVRLESKSFHDKALQISRMGTTYTGALCSRCS